MVRLKDRMSYIFVWTSWISIPYGAIKRLYIKSRLYNYISFQFLMVRLKVHQSGMPNIKTLISIPYGAIKSIKPL